MEVHFGDEEFGIQCNQLPVAVMEVTLERFGTKMEFCPRLKYPGAHTLDSLHDDKTAYFISCHTSTALLTQLSLGLFQKVKSDLRDHMVTTSQCAMTKPEPRRAEWFSS